MYTPYRDRSALDFVILDPIYAWIHISIINIVYTPYRDRSALDSLSVLQEYVVDRRMANFHPAAPPLRPISTYIHLISHMAISGIRAPTNLLAKSVPKSGHFLCSSSFLAFACCSVEGIVGLWVIQAYTGFRQFIPDLHFCLIYSYYIIYFF